MKKSLIVLAVAFVLSLGTASFAQNCTGVISDEAGVINSTDAAVVNSQAAKLVDQGIMAHVVTVDLAKYGVRLADVESAYERKCPNWLGANGHRVGNLLVLIVAPKARLKNAFFGSALTPAFGSEDTVNNLFSKAANPYFRNGQFAAGIAAALSDFGAKNVAYHDQASHPSQPTTIINQAPTDTKSTSHAVEWVFGLLFLTGLILLLIWWFVRRSAIKDDLDAAQQGAQAACQKATNLYRNCDATNPGYADVSAQYTTLSNSVSYDPNTSGLSATAYRTMATAWNDLANDIRGLRTLSAKVDETTQAGVTETFKASAAAAGASVSGGHHHHYETPAQPTVVHETTVIHDNSGGDMLTGVLVGEALANNNDRDRGYRDDPSPSYSDPEPSREESGSDSSWASSSDDSSSSLSSDDSSGSDSSWGDSSTSSDDSSSSFDSGSSDSGSSGGDSSW